MTGIPIRAYARVRGCSESLVRKAIKSGRITANADGSIDPIRANQEWGRNTFQGKGASVVPMELPDLDGGDADRKLALMFKKAKIKEAYFGGEMKELEFKLRKGDLIEVTKAGEFAASFSNIVRDQVSAWADRLTPALAPFLAPGTDEGVIHRLLTREGEATLRKVSKGIADAGY